MVLDVGLQVSPEKRPMSGDPYGAATATSRRLIPKYITASSDQIASIAFTVPDHGALQPGPDCRDARLDWISWTWARMTSPQQQRFVRNIRRLETRSCFRGMGTQQQIFCMFTNFLSKNLGLSDITQSRSSIQLS